MSARRDRMRADGGFTLIEVLVVILIIGILAAIAIPVFIGQREKGQDSAAKSATRNAVSAAAAVATENSGSYTGMTDAKLQAVEPSLSDAGPVKTITAIIGTPDADTYTVTTQSNSNTYFTVTHNDATGLTYRCSAATAAACTSSNGW